MRKQLDQKGFSIVEVLIALVVLAAIAASGWLAWRHTHDKKKYVSSSTSAQQSKSPSKLSPPTDPYAGWKSYCDTATDACIRYPSDWNAVSGFPGSFENAGDTAYISLSPGSVKDRAQDSAFIQSVNELTVNAMPLSIVGYIVNNSPGYGLYDTSYVTSNSLKAGTTAQLVDGNYAFDAKSGTATLVATPGAKGYAAITNMAQAKSWFDTPEAKICFKILQSFYYL